VCGGALSSIVHFDSVLLGDDGLRDSPWPMFGHDPQHTGRSPFDTSMNRGWIKWKFETEAIKDSPVVDVDGTIYVCGNEFLYAVNPDGTLKWVFETRPGTKGWIRSTPAIAEDGTIYIGDRNGYLYAVDQYRGEKRRINIDGSAWVHSPAIGEDGTIYVGTFNDTLCAVSPDGILKWSVEVGYSAFAPAIGIDGTVYVGTYDGYFTAVSPDGEVEWRTRLSGSVREEIAVGDDGSVYVGTSYGYLYAFHENGSVKWRYSVPESWDYIMGLAIGEDGSLYFAIGQGFFYALDKNGSLKWKIKISHIGWETQAFPAIGKDGTIYTVAEGGVYQICGDLCAISLDGEIKWKKKLGAAKPYDVCHPGGLAVGGDGTVYVTTWFMSEEDCWGYLYAFGAGEPNSPPSVPVMSGPSFGIAGVSYDYTIVAFDPEDDPVCYYVDWDDDTHTGWTSEYVSGEEVVLSHRWWYKKLKFTITFQAKDVFDNEGG
jgi:outer membrane protein assembly factor BamB